jgi:hypothetical protein
MLQKKMMQQIVMNQMLNYLIVGDIPKASKENRAFEFTLTFGKVEIEAIAQAKTGEKYENTFDLEI